MTDKGEDIEALTGRKGERGERGERGQPGGLAAGKSRAIVFLFAFSLLFGVANLFWSAHLVSQGNSQRCSTIVAQVTIPVPTPTAGNPSREWEAKFSADERRRGRQLGCTMPPPRFAPAGPG